MTLVGKIPNGKSPPHDVFLVRGAQRYRIVTKAAGQDELPPLPPDGQAAMKRTKQWITRRGGTCLKRPKLMGMEKPKRDHRKSGFRLAE